MPTRTSFGSRLLAVLLPTPAQGLGAVVIALFFLVIAHSQQVLRLIGVDDIAITATRTQLHQRFDALLTSQIASSAALVTFWASVGLIAYLICWSAYNLLIQARNEVTLSTAYTNRGHWRGHLETLCLKATGAVALITVVALLRSGLALWIALATPALTAPSIQNTLVALAAALGLAAQLYVILAFGLMTFTPWYRDETFTGR